MTRKKVKLAYISNDSSRKATFKKRLKGLMKKVNELSTLCDITACAIIYSPYNTNPEVWPSNSGVQKIVSDFRAVPEMDQNKKMVDQETYLTQRITKAYEQLKKQKKENREMEMTEVMFQCLVGNMRMFQFNVIDLNDLGYMIEQYLKNVNRRIEILQEFGVEIDESSNANGVVSIPQVGSSSFSTAATTVFDLMQQQEHRQNQEFHHPEASQVRPYEQPRNFNFNQNYDQSQEQLYMEMMKYPEQMSYVTRQMSFPFMKNNRNHHPQQSFEHQISGNLSTASTTVTNPNVSHKIWFH